MRQAGALRVSLKELPQAFSICPGSLLVQLLRKDEGLCADLQLLGSAVADAAIRY